MTAISIPKKKMAGLAVRSLFRELDGQGPCEEPVGKVFPGELVVRTSTLFRGRRDG